MGNWESQILDAEASTSAEAPQMTTNATSTTTTSNKSTTTNAKTNGPSNTSAPVPLKKPHTWSEATTISSTCDSPTRRDAIRALSGMTSTTALPGLDARRRPSIDDDDEISEESDRSEDEDDTSEEEERRVGTMGVRRNRVRSCASSSWWQHVLSYMLPCYGPDAHPHRRAFMRRNSASPLRRKRPRALSSPVEIQQQHEAFWALVQQMLDLNDVVLMIHALQEYLVQHVGATQCAVFLVDPTTNEMSRIARAQPTAVHLSVERGIVGHVFGMQQPVCRQHFDQDYFFDPEIDLSQESVRHKLLCVPLVEHGVVYAIIEATTACLVHRSSIGLHLQLLSWLGPILSACMRKCIQFHDVLLSERTQKALLHILSSSDTDETVLHLVDGVIAGACHITNAERVSLFMVDWERGELWSLCSSAHDETVRVPIIGSALGVAANNGVTLNITDAETDPRYSERWDERVGIKTRCALYIPVGIEPSRDSEQNIKPMAVLEMLNKDNGEVFTFDDEYAFEAFASEVAVILRRRSNEIQYIKLLADTRADKVLAQRAKSQVNLLECYTEYVANASKDEATDRLHHSLFWSASNEHFSEATIGSEQNKNKCVRIAETTTPIAASTPVTRGESGGDVWSVHFEDESPSSSDNLTLSDGEAEEDGTLWDSNIFEIDPDDLPVLARNMMLEFHLDEILDTDIETLDTFIHAVQEMYHPNPFHNFVHAVSVLHTAYAILRTTDASKMLQPLEIAATLVAALCHDVDHPGHTNAYEIVSTSQLALLYSDDSVLERHHAYTTFRIMAKEKNANILANLSTSDFRYIRKMIVDAILATDMAQHIKMTESLEKMLHTSYHPMASSPIMRCESWPACIPASPINRSTSQGPQDIMSVLREAVCQGEGATTTPRLGGKPPRQMSMPMTQRPFVFNGTQEERSFLVKSIVHASDLCGQVFPKAVALKWSNMVAQEFAYQALLEQADRLPVTYQHIDDPLQLVESQHFFAHKIVAPLWTLMAKMFPELAPCMQNLNENVAHYEREMERLKQVQQEQHVRKMKLEISCEVDPATYSDDEGMAVPGVGRCTPAKFVSIKSKSRSNSRADGMLDLQGLIDQDELAARMQSLKSGLGRRSRSRRSFSVFRASEEEHANDTKEVSGEQTAEYFASHNRRRLLTS